MVETTSKKQSLGKGLSALLGPDLPELPENPTEGIKLDIDMMYISPGRYQPRRIFEEELFLQEIERGRNARQKIAWTTQSPTISSYIIFVI